MRYCLSIPLFAKDPMYRFNAVAASDLPQGKIGNRHYQTRQSLEALGTYVLTCIIQIPIANWRECRTRNVPFGGGDCRCHVVDVGSPTNVVVRERLCFIVAGLTDYDTALHLLALFLT